MSHLRIVKDGEGGGPEQDTRIVDCLRDALKRAEAGEVRGAFIALDTMDGEPEVSCAGDDPLRMASLVDLLLPDVKAYALGIE